MVIFQVEERSFSKRLLNNLRINYCGGGGKQNPNSLIHAIFNSFLGKRICSEGAGDCDHDDECSGKVKSKMTVSMTMIYIFFYFNKQRYKFIC